MKLDRQICVLVVKSFNIKWSIKLMVELICYIFINNLDITDLDKK